MVSVLRGRSGLGRPTRYATAIVAALAVAAGCSAATEPAPDTGVVITAAGDIGASDNALQVWQLARSLHPDVHLALGDLSYAELTPESAWCDAVAAAVGPDFPLELLAGNHDSLDERDGSIEAFTACLPNRVAGMSGDYGREYTIDLPARDPVVRIVAASPNLTFADGRWEYRTDDAHDRWLSGAIRDARSKGVAWVVVAAHFPCPTVGVHTCPPVTDFYHRVMAEGADVVLHGHEHAYQRTYQLREGSPQCPRLPTDAFDEACIADRGPVFAAGAGTVFATAGTGGTALRDVDLGNPAAGYFAALSGRNADPAHGVLRITADRQELRAQFVSTVPGAFADSFTIQRP